MEPVHISTLKYMSLSPAHYRAALSRKVDSAPMRIGRATHAYVLGTEPPAVFDGIRRGKDWEAFKQQGVDRDILSVSENESAEAMAAAVRANADAVHVLTGAREIKLDWKFLGRECQSRIDVLGNNFITELKTSRTAHPQWFAHQALRMHYHAQLAFYRDAAITAGMGRPEAAYIVAVESTAPYAVTVLRLTDRALEQGERAYRLWFEMLLACERDNVWPGYVQSVVDLDVPDELELTWGDEMEAA